MQIGLSLSLSQARSGGGGAAVISAPFASVNSNLTGPSAGPYDSWSVQYASQPTISANVPFTVTRQGYDSTGTVNSSDDLFYVTKSADPGGAVRQPYPNQASQSALTAAMSDYLYSTDTIYGGATNGATFISPTPVCAWVTPHRKVVGNSIGGDTDPIEIVAFHRNARLGKQVACVIWTISDGTTTVTTSPVSTPIISGRAGDMNPVIVYRMPTTDITSLTATTGGIIFLTVNAKVYPHIGAAASIADSSTGTAGSGRDFGPRYYLKNTSLAASPYYAYVKTTGNDGTGVFSTTAATAEATPFLTIVGMFNALNSGAAGKADGVIVRLGNDGGTPFVLSGSATSRNQNLAAITITRDPNVARANARMSFGAGSRLRLLANLVTLTTGCIRFSDLTISRTGTSNISGEAANFLEIQFDNVAIDNGSHSASWLSSSYDYHYGSTLTNIATATNPLNASAATEHRILRGVEGTFNGSASIEGYRLIGCKITAAGILSARAGGRSNSGSIIAFSEIRTPLVSGGIVGWGADEDVTGCALVQNLLEWFSATTGTATAISADSATGSNTHIIAHNNTFIGAFQAGRWNSLYDEGVTARTSKLQSWVGNLLASQYTKGDVFVSNGTRIGNWAFMYGVGCFGEWTQYQCNGALGTDQAQSYGGVGSFIGTSQVTPQMANTNFTDYQGTYMTAGPTHNAGFGGGTYTLTSSSAPVKGIVPSAVLPYDFAGTARPTTLDTAGAYVAP